MRLNTNSGQLRTENQGGNIIATTDIADGNWHHVVSVFAEDGDPDVLDVLHYVDGVLEATSGGTDEPVNTDITGPQAEPVSIGRRAQVANLLYFTGTVDDVYIYDRPLDAFEVANFIGATTPADVAGLPILVADDSTLNSASASAAFLGTVTLQNGILATTGSNPIIFADTSIPEDATMVGFAPEIATLPGIITGEGAGPDVTIAKAGAHDLVLDHANVNLANATFEARAGTLKMIGTDPWGGSTDALLSGGTLFVQGDTAADVPAGAIAHYAFNNPFLFGADSSGNGHHGVTVGDPVLAAGKVGTALDLDGDADGINNTDGGQFLKAATDARTISLWINQEDAIGDQILIDEGGNTNGIGIRVHDGSPQAMIKAGADAIGLTTATPLEPGWHHLAVVYGSSNWTLFIDGAQADTLGTPFAQMPSHSNNPGIGYRNSENPYTGTSFNGLIDEVYYYDAALDAADIVRLYDAGTWVPVPLDMSALSVTVTEDSVLQAATDSSATFGPLTLINGTVTVEGAPAGVTFDGTTLAPAVADMVVGINATMGVSLGALASDGVTPVTFSKSGAGDVILDSEPTGFDEVTVEAGGGRLIGLASPNPFGPAGLQIAGGGELVLAARDAETSPVTFDNALETVGNGTLTAGSGGVGGDHPGGMTINLGSVDNPVTLGDASTLTLRSTGNYSLNLAGDVVGTGGISVTDSAVTIGGFVDAGTIDVSGTGSLTTPEETIAENLNVSGGAITTTTLMEVGNMTLSGGVVTAEGPMIDDLQMSDGTLNAAGATVVNLDMTGGTIEASGDVIVTTMTAAGGTLALNGNQLLVEQSLAAGPATYSIDLGNRFSVSGDLNAGATLGLSGGVLTVDGGIREGGPSTDGLLAYWGFDDGTGDTAVNGITPGTLDGTLTNFPADDSQWAGGVVGGGLSFDGTDDFVNIAGYTGVLGTTPRTVAAWIKTAADNAAIISWGNNSGGQKWVFRTQTSNGRDGAIRVEVNGGYRVGDTDIRDDAWHHVAAVLPAPANNVNQVLLYVDGQLEANSATKGRSINTSANPDVRIGQDHSNRRFPGLMDEVFLYDRALDAAEIDFLYGDGTGPELGPVVLDASGNNLVVTDTSEVIATADQVIAGDLLVQNPGGGNPPTTLTLSAADYTFANVTAEDGATIDGNLRIGGTLTLPGMLSVGGETVLAATATYAATIDGLAVSKLVNTGATELTLGGALTLTPVSVDPTQLGTTFTAPLVEASGEGLIQGEFASVPPAGTPADRKPGHLGMGVFNMGVNSIEAVPVSDPPTFTAVEAELYGAVGGDSNADGNIDGQDIQTLIINFNLQGDPPDRNWLKGDTAGGATGRGDGWVDGQDITDLITHFTGDPGPADPGSVKVEYNFVTGEFIVSAKEVMSWNLITQGGFRPDVADYIRNESDMPTAPFGTFVSSNVNTVGEASFGLPLDTPDVFVGNILADPVIANTYDDARTDFAQLLDSGTLVIDYTLGLGIPKGTITSADIGGDLTLVPEPSTIVMLLAGLAGLLLVWRRRRRA